MSLLQSIIYGLISGLSEFLPVSSQAHQGLFMQMFGIDRREPIRDILVHIALIFVLLSSSRNIFSTMRREKRLAARTKRGNREARGLYDERLVKTAAFPLIAGLLLYLASGKLESSPAYLALFFLLNGIILFVPEHMRQANKDARSMTGLDAILIGISGALSAFPGISRVGATTSVAVARGADKEKALNWSLLLSIPALALFLVFDIIHLISYGVGVISFPVIAGYILSAVAAFASGYIGITLMRFLTVRTGYSGFAYYSWGAALFSFVLYLIT